MWESVDKNGLLDYVHFIYHVTFFLHIFLILWYYNIILENYIFATLKIYSTKNNEAINYLLFTSHLSLEHMDKYVVTDVAMNISSLLWLIV